MESLQELYAQHDGRVSQRWSSYLTTLERTLSSRRHESVRMLEIGVQNGGSLEIWARYLRDANVLVGCDIDEACGLLTFDDPRIHVVVGDVTDPSVRSTIAQHSQQFDVIIDDGSHRSPDIITAFVTMFPLLAAGGVYIVEDLHCSYYASFGGGLFAQRSAMSFLKRLVDVVNEAHWGLDLTPADVLEPLVDGALPEEFLAAIPSIAGLEFVDSMCIIRRDDGAVPRLGTRVVTGTVADVDAGPLVETGRPLVGERQVVGAVHVDPLEREHELQRLMDDRARRVHQEKVLRQELAEVWARLERIIATPSYRLMNGPRRVFTALFRR